jgi:ribose transport system substrate-binding protein
MKRNVLLAAALTVPFLCVTALVRAEEPCSAYPTGTAEKIESVDLEKTFGAVPAPKKPLHFVYVTFSWDKPMRSTWSSERSSRQKR